ncbi:hypothetical protein A2625_04680 [candidate division WOR-1 bacterium RIFCSPHIGHO2_01_FULL_53_15]|uniref:Uncharacterized protein n=1 Tax=candidate division WOR-1 bacterium RIFCSPHIGHO2_01_FULL_53_15 TaxID=1802564 RepID=A0A1F4PYX4_UNCSA|nr:MAG: hypothetical protein A2625_04680 [candidate division WOR-1 bacterium RIFCSPHIGHO2_01_FULL_53_15]OGC10631.1 MAG: hypothetical protein A3D23_03900 [candidate division WOR-1 bacterium RIFCSPHIGHO2_02_FULL_53_26]
MMDLKKAYYYIICLASLFVLFWGLVDLSGAAVGLAMARPSIEQPAPPSPEGDQSLDLYYQKKILYDRLSDGLARIVIAGLVFAYSRGRVNKLES